jgi:hypothetical protein
MANHDPVEIQSRKALENPQAILAKAVEIESKKAEAKVRRDEEKVPKKNLIKQQKVEEKLAAVTAKRQRDDTVQRKLKRMLSSQELVIRLRHSVSEKLKIK